MVAVFHVKKEIPIYMGNVGKNELPEFQQKLQQLFFGNKDKLFLFMLCKSCLAVSSVPLAAQKTIVQPRKFEIV